MGGNTVSGAGSYGDGNNRTENNQIDLKAVHNQNHSAHLDKEIQAQLKRNEKLNQSKEAEQLRNLPETKFESLEKQVAAEKLRLEKQLKKTESQMKAEADAKNADEIANATEIAKQNSKEVREQLLAQPQSGSFTGMVMRKMDQLKKHNEQKAETEEKIQSEVKQEKTAVEQQLSDIKAQEDSADK